MVRLHALSRATSALIAVPLLAAAPSSAECLPDPAASGQTVTCTGTDANGFVAGGGVNNLTVNVLAGAIVTAPIDALLLNAGSTVNNAGLIAANGAGARGVALLSVFSPGNMVANSGTIAASGGAIGVFMDGGNTVTNTGTIVARGSGSIGIFTVGPGDTVVNAAGGLIFADAASGATVLFSSAGNNDAVINNGTVDGRIVDVLQLTNNGLLQFSTGAVGQSSTPGNFTQTATGTLALRVNAAGARDAIQSGGATLGGSLRAVVQPGLYNAVTTYPGMLASTFGFFGTQFAAVASTSPFLAASAVYTPTSVDLTLTRIGFGAVPGSTANQQAVGNALEGQYSTAATGAAAVLYGTLFVAPSVGVLDALTGEVGTGVQNPSFAGGDAFFGALLGQLRRWRMGAGGGGPQGNAAYRVELAAAGASAELAQAVPGGAGWPPAVGRRFAVWASGFGLGGSRDGDGSTGSARLGYSMGGGAVGFDAALTPDLALGLAFGGSGASFSLDGRASSGTARMVWFGAYGSWTRGALYADAALAYGHGQFSTTRTIAIPGIAELATGGFDGNQLGGRVEAGWRFAMQRSELTPFAGVTVQSLRQDAYSETSTNTATGAPGILGLGYQAQTTTSVRSQLGLQAATTFAVGERMSLTPRLRAAWAHEFNAGRQVNASFLSLPGAAFTVSGARPARDAAVVSAGVDWTFGRTVSLFAQFDGDLSGGGSAYAGTGGIRIAW